MKNYLLRIAIVLGALMMTVTAQGVLKEKNFQQTLNVLRAELEQNYLKQKVIMQLTVYSLLKNIARILYSWIWGLPA